MAIPISLVIVVLMLLPLQFYLRAGFNWFIVEADMINFCKFKSKESLIKREGVDLMGLERKREREGRKKKTHRSDAFKFEETC